MYFYRVVYSTDEGYEYGAYLTHDNQFSEEAFTIMLRALEKEYMTTTDAYINKSIDPANVLEKYIKIKDRHNSFHQNGEKVIDISHIPTPYAMLIERHGFAAIKPINAISHEDNYDLMYRENPYYDEEKASAHKLLLKREYDIQHNKEQAEWHAEQAKLFTEKAEAIANNTYVEPEVPDYDPTDNMPF